jgi:hypothetical protein
LVTEKHGEADLAFPTHGVNLRGGMTADGVPTVSIAFIYSTGWEGGQPAGEEDTTPLFAMPIPVVNDVIKGLQEMRDEVLKTAPGTS